MISRYECTACNVTSAVEVLDVEPGAHGDIVASVRMHHATCPACGKRNPEGVREQNRDERNITIITITTMSALTVGAYFVWWLALPVVGLLGVMTAMFFVKQPTWWGALNLAQLLAVIAFAWFVPRWAFLVPALQTLVVLVGRQRAEQLDAPWQRAAEELRFFDDSQRRL